MDLDENELLKIQEVAALLKISVANVEYLIRHGRGPHVTRLSYKLRRVRYGDFLAWIRAHAQPPGRQPRFRAPEASK